jgi:hypothetical protein
VKPKTGNRSKMVKSGKIHLPSALSEPVAKPIPSFALFPSVGVPSGFLRICECILTDDSTWFSFPLPQLSRSRTKVSHNETKCLKVHFL